MWIRNIFEKKRLFTFIFIFGGIALLAKAQNSAGSLASMGLDTGIRPNETYDRAQENINVASGNLNIQIPLVHLPGRHGHNLDINLTYNSQIWNAVATLKDPPQLGYSGGNVDKVYIGWQASSYVMRNPVAIGDGG
jgi:hypothetical protein